MTTTVKYFSHKAYTDPKPAPEVDPEPTPAGTPEIEPPISPVVPIPNII